MRGCQEHSGSVFHSELRRACGCTCAAGCSCVCGFVHINYAWLCKCTSVTHRDLRFFILLKASGWMERIAFSPRFLLGHHIALFINCIHFTAVPAYLLSLARINLVNQGENISRSVSLTIHSVLSVSHCPHLTKACESAYRNSISSTELAICSITLFLRGGRKKRPKLRLCYANEKEAAGR